MIVMIMTMMRKMMMMMMTIKIMMINKQGFHLRDVLISG